MKFFALFISLSLVSFALAKLKVDTKFECRGRQQVRLHCDVYSTTTVTALRVLKQKDGSLTETVAFFRESETYSYDTYAKRCYFSHHGFKTALQTIQHPYFKVYYSVWVHLNNVSEHDYGMYVCSVVNKESESRSSKPTKLSKPMMVYQYKKEDFFSGKRKLAFICATSGAVLLIVTVLLACCCCGGKKYKGSPNRELFKKNLSESFEPKLIAEKEKSVLTQNEVVPDEYPDVVTA